MDISLEIESASISNKLKTLIIRLIIIIIVTSAILMGCSSKMSTTTYKEPLSEIDSLNRFFCMCESDIKCAIKIINDSDIIETLTHLRRMDDGGKKYYLLEREVISEIIRSVTEGIYSDLILINRNGSILYTMTNNDIFGKNVKTFLNGSAVYNGFIKSAQGEIYIEDISIFPPITGSANLFISIRDDKGKSFRGTFIMQIDINIIERILKNDLTVIGLDGKYRIAKYRDNIMKPYAFFDKIDLKKLSNNKIGKFQCEDKVYTYYPFRFKNIFWIVISEYHDNS